jgi:hypothetical protein
MRLIKYEKPNGGFEITIKAAVFLFQKWDNGGCIKVALFSGIKRNTVILQ